MTTLATHIRPRLRVRSLPVVLLGVVLVIASLLILHAGRGTTFFFDDWNFVTMRLGWRPYVLLYPHNEHLSLLPVLIYKVLFETVGLAHYGAFRAVALILDLTCAVLLFVYARRRLGEWVALGMSAALVLMGAGAYDIVWAFQIGFLASLAAILGALLALDRGTRRGDIAACVLVVVALSSSSHGLMLVAAVFVEVLLRPDRRSRIWIPLIPLVLYAIWYLKYGTGHLDVGNIPTIPTQVYGGLSAGATSATGMPADYAGAIALVLIGCFIYSLPRAPERLPRLFMVAALGVAFWGLEALARTGISPAEPRYLYPDAVYFDLLACEAFFLFAPGRIIGIAIAVVLGAGALTNITQLNLVGNALRSHALSSRSSLTAAELLQDRLDPRTAIPDPGQSQLVLGRYESAVKAYGSTITWSPSEIPKRSADERSAVDTSLIRLIGPYPAPPPAKPPAKCPGYPGDGKDRPDVLRHGRAYVKAGSAPVEVRLRRFGPSLSPDPQVKVDPGRAATVALPPDRSPQPWVVVVRSSAPFNACNL